MGGEFECNNCDIDPVESGLGKESTDKHEVDFLDLEIT